MPVAQTPIRATTTLRVAYVVKRFPRFSETFVINEILALERRGIEVTVFSLLRPPAEQQHAFTSRLRAPVIYLSNSHLAKTGVLSTSDASGVVVERPLEDLLVSDDYLEIGLPVKDSKKAAQLITQSATLATLLVSRQIRHVHAHFASNATTVAMLASRLTGIPYSFTAHARDIYHTYVDPDVDDNVRRRKIDEAAFVVTVSEANRRHLSRLAEPAERHRLVRLYNGVDLSCFRPSNKTAEAGLFVAVGRLVEKKGFVHLVNACEELRRQRRDFRCLVIGDGPLREELVRRVGELSLEHHVSFAGALPQEKLRDTLSTAVALVLPSIVTPTGDRDALPTVLLEAMAMGLPAISTRVGGIPEIIDDGETGWLVNPGNAAELASAMNAVLRDPETSRKKGLAGRRKATREFDLDNNVSRLAKLFQSCLRETNLHAQSGNDAACLRYG